MKTTFSNLKDTELLAMMAEGSEAAFSELYGRYFDPLFVNGVQLLGDADVAGDVVQDVFADFWQRRATLGIRSSVKGYLYGAVRHGVLNAIRQRQVSSAFLDGLLAAEETFSAAADEDLRLAELQRVIDEAVERLPARMREVFELSREGDKSQHEIADQLGVSENTVKSQLANSRAKLRKSLGDWIFLSLIINSL